jgi:hypothetical protein
MEVSCQFHGPAAVRPDGVALCANCVRDWLCSSASLDGLEKRKFLTLPGV